ncbi:MAG: helix-turn-helix domain-containing protein [Treponema sp.]|nr:helix-turn-helix domain-containing protein [Treponema sp.]
MAEGKENIFARRVKDLMKENRYSQKKLCEICGITEAAFSRYMTSDRMPRTDVLANIANTLHTTSDYLLGNETHYGYDQLKILLASSKDDLSKNQKLSLIDILMDEYNRPEEK